MKICFDENISPRVANAVLALTGNRKGFEVCYVRQLFGPSTPDPHWMKHFAGDDGTAIVSGDYDILQHWPNLIAYIESGLISFFPPTVFKRLRGYSRAALLIRWWPTIIEKIKMSDRGDIWRMPMTWTPDIGSMKQIHDPRVAKKIADDEVTSGGKIYQLRPTK